jgi:site-specific DNA-methyltransferase (adenine-specific)/site-specific DNA-methyltransferase (cytosine-N4-specific)
MSYLLAVADVARIPLPDRSVDLVFGSPPYCDARSYGIGAQRHCQQWVDWMLPITAEALRVARNCVIWIAAGVTRDRNYWPACEGLMWEWWRQGGSAYRPCYWRRVGIPGSGGNDWFRFDVEYCMCFKRDGALLWSDNTAMGHTPKQRWGGNMSYRTQDGSRVKRHRAGGRNRDGSSKYFEAWALKRGYINPELSNPGNLIDTGTAGGSNTGHAIAHENEAPFSEALAEWWIRSLCKPGGIVLDPFSGSGTTVSVAERLGRIGLGFDIRQSQAKIATQRLERPHQPVVKIHKHTPMPLFGE